MFRSCDSQNLIREAIRHNRGTIRAALERVGRPIGAYDLLIAAQAVRHKITLVTAKVTANTKEFSRVKGLVWEDWAKVRA